MSAAVNGTAKTAPVTAHMGDTVQLTVTCAGGFQVVDDTLTVKPVNISDQIFEISQSRSIEEKCVINHTFRR